MGKRKIISSVGVVCGVILIVVIGVVGWVVVPNIIDNKIKDQTDLTNDETLDKWSNVTIPVQLKFYIYNCLNPQGYLNGEKLEFEERGPYVYSETRNKNPVFSNDESTVTYNQTIHYYFDEQASNGTEDDRLWVPNIPFITIAHLGGALNNETVSATIETAIGMLTSFGGESLFSELSIREILFEGRVVSPFYGELIKPPIFGLYLGKNGTADGEYVVKTGHNNHEDFGQIVTFNGQEELKYWYTKGLDPNSPDHFCNKINGSDGSIFPPFITKDTTLRIFNTEVCRSIWLTYESETTYKDISAYKFTIPSEMFAAPSDNANNECFCPQQSPFVASQCGQGVVRIYPCKNNAPIVTSNPHFLEGGEEFFQPIVIDRPDKDLHETFIELEPKSGVLLRASKKIQINVEVQRIPRFTFFKDLDFSSFTQANSVLLPVFWAEEIAQLDDDNASDLYDKLIKPQKAVKIARWVVIAIGGIITFVSAVFLFTAFKK